MHLASAVESRIISDSSPEDVFCRRFAFRIDRAQCQRTGIRLLPLNNDAGRVDIRARFVKFDAIARHAGGALYLTQGLLYSSGIGRSRQLPAHCR